MISVSFLADDRDSGGWKATLGYLAVWGSVDIALVAMSKKIRINLIKFPFLESLSYFSCVCDKGFSFEDEAHCEIFT